MKSPTKYALILISSMVFFDCGDSKKDTSATNIQSESAGSSSNPIVVTEDLSIDNGDITTYPVDKLTESMEKLLSTKGKSLNNINTDQSIYVIASASSGIPSNRSGFLNSRNIAFAKAELRAKTEILRLSSEIITSERQSTLIDRAIQGSDPDAKEKATLLDKALKVVDKSLDNALEKLGVSSEELASMNEEQKEKTFQDYFYNYTSSFVASMLKGVVTLKVVEGEVGNNDYQVAVCVRYTPEDQERANSRSVEATTETINSGVANNLRDIDADKLISKMGAQVLKDDNGNYFLIGFGQSAVRKSGNRQSEYVGIARRKSRLSAVQNIKNYLAEDLVAKEIIENVEKISTYTDGQENLYTEDNFTSLINSRRSSVEISSLVLREWEAVHPVSKTNIVGSVVVLTANQNVNFNGRASTTSTEKSDFIESEQLEGEEI